MEGVSISIEPIELHNLNAVFIKYTVLYFCFLKKWDANPLFVYAFSFVYQELFSWMYFYFFSMETLTETVYYFA